MDNEIAPQFAEKWLDAWNSHDLDAVLSHFTDDVVFSSPMAAKLREGSDGIVRGKAALRDYWAEGLRRVPDLHFEIESLYAGVHTLVINYRNQAGGLVNEVLVFDGALVAEGHGTYLVQRQGLRPPAAKSLSAGLKRAVQGIGNFGQLFLIQDVVQDEPEQQADRLVPVQVVAHVGLSHPGACVT
jgi:hypothetical protein